MPLLETRMKRMAIVMLLVTATAQRASADTLASWKETPPISVGVTGMIVTVTSSMDDLKQAKADTPHVVTVTEVLPETPADGNLRQGDILESVNGVSLKVVDPRHILGEQINASEGRDGEMIFAVRRNGATNTVTIQLDPIGSYSKTFPINCEKSKTIVDQTAAFILENGGPEGGITGALEALFLMSTGEA